MELTENQRKTLNSASKDARMAKKKIDMVIEEDSNSNKFRRQETADSDECTEVPES